VINLADFLTTSFESYDDVTKWNNAIWGFPFAMISFHKSTPFIFRMMRVILRSQFGGIHSRKMYDVGNNSRFLHRMINYSYYVIELFTL